MDTDVLKIITDHIFDKIGNEIKISKNHPLPRAVLFSSSYKGKKLSISISGAVVAIVKQADDTDRCLEDMEILSQIRKKKW